MCLYLFQNFRSFRLPYLCRFSHVILLTMKHCKFFPQRNADVLTMSYNWGWILIPNCWFWRSIHLFFNSTFRNTTQYKWLNCGCDKSNSCADFLKFFKRFSNFGIFFKAKCLYNNVFIKIYFKIIELKKRVPCLENIWEKRKDIIDLRVFLAEVDLLM